MNNLVHKLPSSVSFILLKYPGFRGKGTTAIPTQSLITSHRVFCCHFNPCLHAWGLPGQELHKYGCTASRAGLLLEQLSQTLMPARSKVLPCNVASDNCGGLGQKHIFHAEIDLTAGQLVAPAVRVVLPLLTDLSSRLLVLKGMVLGELCGMASVKSQLLHSHLRLGGDSKVFVHFSSQDALSCPHSFL